MPVKKAVTPHGDVEYKTVTCDSCENETKKDDALRFTVGRSSNPDVKGWACPYCADAGPVSFPNSIRFPRIRHTWRGMGGDDKLFVAYIVFVVVFCWGVVFL